MIGAHRFISVALGVARRSITVFFRTPSLIMPATLFPLFFLVAFAGGINRVSDVPGFSFPAGYTSFVYAFVLLQAMAFGGVFSGFSVARDFEGGFAGRLLLAAPNRKGIVAGYACLSLTRGTFSGLVVTLAALVGGMDVAGAWFDIVYMFSLALIVNLSAFLWSCGVAMRFRTIQAGPLMQVPVILVLFLAPVYLPIELLTGWIHTVAQVNPLTPVVEALRALISGTSAHLAEAYLIGVALVLLFTIWALVGLRRAENSS